MMRCWPEVSKRGEGVIRRNRHGWHHLYSVEARSDPVICPERSVLSMHRSIESIEGAEERRCTIHSVDKYSARNIHWMLSTAVETLMGCVMR